MFPTKKQPEKISNRYNGLKVLFMTADNSACGYYRCINPAWYLAAHGADVLSTNTCSPHHMTQYDIIICQRQYSETSMDLVDFAQRLGKYVIYEVDDNLHSVHTESPVYGVYHTGTKQNNLVKTIIEKCQGISVSTHELATDYYELNNNMVVLPNSIDFAIRDWETREDRTTDKLTIGWSGGGTHSPDLEILNEAMSYIIKKYENVDVALYTNDFLREKCVREWRIPENRLVTVKSRDFNDYPSGLSNFDIALCPIVNARFNAAKSNLKVLECGTYKAAVVASVSAPYSTTITQGSNGLLASNTRDWIDHISYLIENPNERTRMGNSIYDLVRKEYDMNDNVHYWPLAWNMLVQNTLNNSTPKPLKPLYGNIGRNDDCPCGCGKKYKKCVSFGAWG